MLVEQVRDELHALAQQAFRGQAADHTLQPTALLSELWVRLLESDRFTFSCPAAFRAWAAKAMRNILIDHARRKCAIKRGGGRKPHRLDAGRCLASVDLVELDDSLQKLNLAHPRSAQVVEMRFFGGMSDSMIAQRLGVSERTVRSDWAMARAWLFRELGVEHDGA